MNPIDIIMLVIRGISTLTHNRALGGGGISSDRTAFLLETLAVLIEGGAATWADLKAFSKEIEALVATNGEPSRGQWDAMIARDLAVRKQLDANLVVVQQEMQGTLHPAQPAAPVADLTLPPI